MVFQDLCVFCLKKRTRAHVQAAAERISAGNKAHTEAGSEPGELREGCCLQRQTQHPRKRRRISTYWGLVKTDPRHTLHVDERDAGGYFLWRGTRFSPKGQLMKVRKAGEGNVSRWGRSGWKLPCTPTVLSSPKAPAPGDPRLLLGTFQCSNVPPGSGGPGVSS